MKITRFTADNRLELRNSLNAALVKIEQEFGITINLGGFSYDSDGTNFTTKLDVNTINTKTAEFRNEFSSLGFDPRVLIGKSFKLKNTVYRVTEYVSSRPKYPLTCITDRGKTWFMPTDSFDKAIAL